MYITREPKEVAFARNEQLFVFNLSEYADGESTVQLRVTVCYWPEGREGYFSAPQILPAMLVDVDDEGKSEVKMDLLPGLFLEPECPSVSELERLTVSTETRECVVWYLDCRAVVDGEEVEQLLTDTFYALRGENTPERNKIGYDGWNPWNRMQWLPQCTEVPMVIGKSDGMVRSVERDGDELLHVWLHDFIGPNDQGVEMLYVRWRESTAMDTWHTTQWVVRYSHVTRLTVSPLALGVSEAASWYEVQLSYKSDFSTVWGRTYTIHTEYGTGKTRLLGLSRWGVLEGILGVTDYAAKAEGEVSETLRRRAMSVEQVSTTYTTEVTNLYRDRVHEAQAWPCLYAELDGLWHGCATIGGEQSGTLGPEPGREGAVLQWMLGERRMFDRAGLDLRSRRLQPDEPDEPVLPDDPIVPLLPYEPDERPEPDQGDRRNLVPVVWPMQVEDYDDAAVIVY